MAGTAFAGGGMGRLLADVAPAPALRVGILSDIHVRDIENADWFEKALRQFDAQKVEAVLVAGDLTIWSRKSELEAVAATWFKVFPGDRRSDGAHVERLFITGNHDVDGFNAVYAKPKFNSYEDVERDCFFAHRKEVWRELFGEDYAPIGVKRVKGYAFVLRNWYSRLSSKGKNARLLPPDCKAEKNPTPGFMKRIAAELPADRPFFYVQHEPMNGTVIHKGRTPDQRLDATAKTLSAFPNSLALTGHSHFTLTDERSIWQGAFTAVNCSCARGYAFSPPGRENGHSGLDFHRDPPFEMPPFDFRNVRQSMVMDVFADRIAFRRLDIVNAIPLGDDWEVPLFGGRTVPPSGTPKYAFAARAAASLAPQFPPDAKVQVTEIAAGHRRDASGRKMDPAPRPQVVVSFPPVAAGRSSGRGFDFSVTAEMRQDDRTWLCIVQEKRVFSPNFCMAGSMDTAPVKCAFARADIPKARDIRFTVRPFNCWGKAGEPIASEWMRFPAAATS